MILLYDKSERSQGLKGGDGVRGGMSSSALEDFNIDGAIPAVDIGTLVQRDGKRWLVRSGGGRN
jgi:hypothetical protein